MITGLEGSKLSHDARQSGVRAGVSFDSQYLSSRNKPLFALRLP
jgi:hypothetical protein